jgi:hypothetical protein
MNEGAPWGEKTRALYIPTVQRRSPIPRDPSAPGISSQVTCIARGAGVNAAFAFDKLTKRLRWWFASLDVFVLNTVDGCIPSDFGVGTTAEIEEERRLLYVAMTRARDHLHLIIPQGFYVRQQTRQGDRHLYAARTRAGRCDWPGARFEQAQNNCRNEPVGKTYKRAAQYWSASQKQVAVKHERCRKPRRVRLANRPQYTSVCLLR